MVLKFSGQEAASPPIISGGEALRAEQTLYCMRHECRRPIAERPLLRIRMARLLRSGLVREAAAAAGCERPRGALPLPPSLIIGAGSDPYYTSASPSLSLALFSCRAASPPPAVPVCGNPVQFSHTVRNAAQQLCIKATALTRFLHSCSDSAARRAELLLATARAELQL